MAVAPKRAATAYFIFSEEKRVEAREECLAEAGTDKISVAIVAKKIGEKWRALSDEEKARCA
jgi:DNA-directed RNA polymerase I subunit RPA43